MSATCSGRWPICSSAYTDTPIILLTTDSDSKVKKETRSLSANGWLMKPSESERSTHAVAKLLRSRQAS